MQGPPKMQAQRMAASQSAIAPVAMRGQDMSGNKRASVDMSFRLLGVTNQVSGVISWPAGTIAGDSAVIISTRSNGALGTITAMGATVTQLYGSMSWDTTTYYTTIWKAVGITEADLKNPPTVVGNRAIVLVYRSARTITQKTSGTAPPAAAGSAAPYSVTGFSAQARARTIAWMWNLEIGTQRAAPTGFNTLSGAVFPDFMNIVESPSYSSGAVVWTDTDAYGGGGATIGLGFGLIEVAP